MKKTKNMSMLYKRIKYGGQNGWNETEIHMKVRIIDEK